MAHIPADRDATLIESPEGELANGSGPSMFAGRTNQPMFGVRRALVRFDVAAALPEDAIIDRVDLTLYENRLNLEPVEVGLHRVLGDWGEGASFSNGGSGAPSEPGDATWLHRFYDADYWAKPGGHFLGRASATTAVRGADFFVWRSTVQMANDVRLWLHAPSRNFGWLILGDEDARGSVKSFASRQNADDSLHPLLTVEYHLPVR